MSSRILLGSMAVLLTAIAPAWGNDKPALTAGNYILYYSFVFNGYDAPEQALCLIQAEKKGGDLKGSLLDTAPKLPKFEMESFKVDGQKIDIAFDLGGRRLTFQGSVSAKDPKSAVGSFGDNDLTSRASLVATDKEKLEKDLLERKLKDVPESLTKAKPLVRKIQGLYTQLARAKSDETKAELQKKIDEAKTEVVEKAIPSLKEVVEKNDNPLLVIEAGLGLLRVAETYAKPEESSALLKKIDAAANPFGPRFQLNLLITIADALKGQKGFSAVTAEAVAAGAKILAESPSVTTQVRLEKALLASYEKDGKTDLAKQVEASLAKLETALDKEYRSKVPPFKPKAFEGRKAKSDKVVVFELFTGSECPPCVAADVAFEGLNKSYKPTDLILIQYHLHIPRPDPLTNADTVERAKFYSLRSTPSTLVDGKPASPGGGGMGNSEGKYKQYQAAINPRIEESTEIKLDGKVTTKGEKLSIKVNVDGIKVGTEGLKLRLMLVEETVKFVGGNGIRFHHQVVRAMPGGAAGVELKGPKESKTVDVDVAEVRKGLIKYLDDFSKNAEFSNPGRPLALKNLRVIALVQDDSTKEIRQAVQLEVPEFD